MLFNNFAILLILSVTFFGLALAKDKGNGQHPPKNPKLDPNCGAPFCNDENDVSRFTRRGILARLYQEVSEAPKNENFDEQELDLGH